MSTESAVEEIEIDILEFAERGEQVNPGKLGGRLDGDAGISTGGKPPLRRSVETLAC